MTDKWVILELSSKADGEDPDLIKKSITYSLKGAEVFIPAGITQVGADRVVYYLMEGYAFIRNTFEQKSYARLENSRYVQSVLTTVSRSNGRTVKNLSFVTDADIERMKRQIHRETDQGIGVGDTVLITSGAYKQITATIIEEIPEEDKVQVHIQLLSKDSIITLPRSFLRLVEKAQRPEYMVKYEDVRSWFNDAVDVLRLPPATVSLEQLNRKHQDYLAIAQHANRIEPLSDAVRAFYVPLDVSKLHQEWARFEQLFRWEASFRALSSFPKRFPKAAKLEAAYEKFITLRKLQRKLEKLGREVKVIERSMVK